MTFEEELAQLNAWLRNRGIQHSMEDLYYQPALGADCSAELLELWRRPLSLRMRTVVAAPLLAGGLNAPQRHEVLEILLKAIKQNAGKGDPSLEHLVLNELADLIDSSRVQEIGQMMLDERYGEQRATFTYVLRKIANSDAIEYLRRAAKDSQTAALALDALARLRVDGTLSLCEEALKDPNLRSSARDAIKETWSRLQRRLAKKQPKLSHITRETIPDGLAEWSANLDGSELAKTLRSIKKCVDGGFAKQEISEVQAAADGLSVDEESRLRFEVEFEGKKTAMWVEVFCDDENAYDLYIFGVPALVDRITSESEGSHMKSDVKT